MNRHAATAAAGIAGLVIGAGGWALLGPTKAHTVTRTVTAAAAPSASSSNAPTTGHYASAQAIADKLEAAGFVVSMLHKSTDDTSASLGMDASYDFDVTEKTGPAPGDSGINMFRNPDSLATWVGMSKAFGGIAVVGDTWAVTLASDNAPSVKLSKEMAPKIAKVLGGTVQE